MLKEMNYLGKHLFSFSSVQLDEITCTSPANAANLAGTAYQCS